MATHSEKNMYGCTPCPKCGGAYRWPGVGVVHCDDCGTSELRTRGNSVLDEDEDVEAGVEPGETT